MAIKEYLDEQGLARLAEDLEVRHPSTYVGERASWDALPSTDKAKYKLVNLTDESSIYLYDTTNSTLSPFIAVIRDVNTLPSSGILNTIYRLTPTTWNSATVVLSSSDMDTNTTNLEEIGFATEESENLYTYTPAKKHIRYAVNDDEHNVGKLEITSAGVMTVYDPEDTELYTGSIVDGDYSFFTKDLISFWIGDATNQTCERIATYKDITGGGSIETIQSLQDIFDISSEQIVIGDNSLEFIDGDESIDIHDASARTAFENSSVQKEFNIDYNGIELSNTPAGGSKSIDFKMDRNSVAMNNNLKESFKEELGIGESLNDKQDKTLSESMTIDGDSVTTVESALNKLNDKKQNKTLENSLTIDGNLALTVESALGYLNTKKLNASEKGEPNGIAELDSTGKVPAAQLPAYVDDIIEAYYKPSDGKFYSQYEEDYQTVTPVGTENPSEEGWYEYDGTDYNLTTDTTVVSGKTYYEFVQTWTTEITPENGIIYVDLLTDMTYRWSGDMYVPIRGDLVLGETAETAYRGDRGKHAYDLSNENKLRIETILTNFAPIEVSPAEDSHDAGTLLIYNDVLYNVLEDIAVDDALVVNDNIMQVDLDFIATFITNLTAKQEELAEEFSTSKAYETGDIVSHDLALYKFKADKAAGEWDSTKVDSVTVADLISSTEPNELTTEQVNTLIGLLG